LPRVNIEEIRGKPKV